MKTTLHLPPFSKAQVIRYCAVSGDDNPIHSDPQVIAKLGLRTFAVPGALALQSLESHIAKAVKPLKILKIECNFVNISYIDESFSLQLRHHLDASNPVLRFVLKNDASKIILMGSASIQP